MQGRKKFLMADLFSYFWGDPRVKAKTPEGGKIGDKFSVRKGAKKFRKL